MRLRNPIAVTGLIIVLLELGVALAIGLAYGRMQAADLYVSRLQDQMRQREILDLRDLSRLVNEWQHWAVTKQVPPSALSVQLIGWFKQDLDELGQVLSYNPKAGAYLNAVDSRWQALRTGLQTVEGALKSGQFVKAQSAFQSVLKLAKELSARLNDESAGIYNPESIASKVIEQQQSLRERFEDTLLVAVAANLLLVLGLCAYCWWRRRARPETFNSAFGQRKKLLALIWVPLVSEVLFLALLSMMFFHGYDSLMKIEQMRTSDRNHQLLYSNVVALVSHQVKRHSSLMSDIDTEISALRDIHKNRQQQLYSLTVIDSGINQIVILLEDARQKGAQQQQSEAQLDESLVKQLFERVIIHVRYGLADVGEKASMETKERVMAGRVDAVEHLELLMILGLGLNGSLALLFALSFPSLSKRVLLMVAVPLALEIMLIFALTAVLAPFQKSFQKSVENYSLSQALSNLRNDVTMLQDVLASSFDSESYVPPDWIIQQTKSRNQGRAYDDDYEQALAQAKEKPRQIETMPGGSYEFWSDLAREHLRDLDELTDKRPDYKSRTEEYKALFRQFSDNVELARSSLKQNQVDKAINSTALARVALKRCDRQVADDAARNALELEEWRHSAAGLDEQKLRELSGRFTSVLLAGLMLNLIAAVVLSVSVMRMRLPVASTHQALPPDKV